MKAKTAFNKKIGFPSLLPFYFCLLPSSFFPVSLHTCSSSPAEASIVSSLLLSPSSLPIFAGSFNKRDAKTTSQTTPELADRRPQTKVSVRGVIRCSDQPAMAVESVHTINSIERDRKSVV